MSVDVTKLTIKNTHEHLIGGDFSAVELTQAYLDKIEKENPDINAYVEVFDDAIEQARIADARIKTGDTHLLTGIPLAIKDNILIEGRRATSGSKILEGFISPYDATVISKLRSAGALFLGRANMDEFAMGSSTEHSAYGPTKNPLDTERVPGGSSGGSAAAVAMHGAVAALGSDTGGSVRQPASFCGCVGLKPTYGSISRYGLMALASSFDQIGPLTHTVSDAEILFETLKGKDPKDSTSGYPDRETPRPHTPLRIGVPRHFLSGDGIHPSVRDALTQTEKRYKELGYEIIDIDLPSIEHSLAVYYIIMPAEASSNLARFDGVKYGFKKEGKDLLEDYLHTRQVGFGKEVRKRIMLGTYVLSSGYYDAYYSKALAVQKLIRKDFEEAFRNVDCILTPTAPTPPFKIGEKSTDPLEMYLADIFTVSANITGMPALSIPVTETETEGKTLSIGMQLVAPHYREDILFSSGKTLLKE